MTGMDPSGTQITWSWRSGVKVWVAGMEVRPGDSANVLMLVILVGWLGNAWEGRREAVSAAIERGIGSERELNDLDGGMHTHLIKAIW
jgi:hypothetical protein